ncbi:MAG TPA: SDR family oxidoreductase [Verrucomicrobiae bacterium]|jgi:UDP-N-acetylglucosamine 4-epimerase
MTEFESLKSRLKAEPMKWLVTGVAGFIGSHLLETLLRCDQTVTGLDNFSTGRKENLSQVKEAVGSQRWSRFTWIEGDIRDCACCQKAVENVDYVLHQAAVGSVPRSLEDPIRTNDSNVNGFVNLLWAARCGGVKRFIFASSSSVYGDERNLPQTEGVIGNCLSPYAVSKRVNELYADAFSRCYEFDSIGLRYFNVFGPRQDPNGAYAAVIPKWISALIQNKPAQINGDGTTSRDFCYIANVVQANLLAATVQSRAAVRQVYNIALGGETSLNSLFEMLRERLAKIYPHLRNADPVRSPFRPGDIRHSRADIGKARRLLGYEPTHPVAKGIDEALDWYVRNSSKETN